MTMGSVGKRSSMFCASFIPSAPLSRSPSTTMVGVVSIIDLSSADWSWMVVHQIAGRAKRPFEQLQNGGFVQGEENALGIWT